jgi:hypothetical protein
VGKDPPTLPPSLVQENGKHTKTDKEAAAVKFASYAKSNGLALNAAKTQLMFSSSAGCADKVTVVVDGARICSSNTLDLLRVKFDRKFSTAPHIEKVARATENRASLIKRMLHHIAHSPGQYLRQLALVLVH